MDMGRRPARPSNPPVADPMPAVPAPRPVRQAPRPVAKPAPQPRQQAPQPRPAHQPRSAAPEPQEVAPAVKTSGGWRTFVQVLIGLVVIAAVASAIVVLYVRYYQ